MSNSYHSWSYQETETGIFTVFPADFFDDGSIVMSNEKIALTFNETTAKKISAFPEMHEALSQMTALLKEISPFISALGLTAENSSENIDSAIIDNLVDEAQDILDSLEEG